MMYINTNQSDQLIECDYQRLDIIDATNYKTDVLPTGGTESQVYEFRVRAVDSGGLVSENWTETSVTIRVPEQPSVAHRFDGPNFVRSEEHTSELQSRGDRVCRLLL